MDSLQYNTSREPLIIPEYGRHIHIMIAQVMALSDREERNKMAKAIIGVMGNLNPHLRDVPDFQHKLWDQLFIMSCTSKKSCRDIPQRQLLYLLDYS